MDIYQSTKIGDRRTNEDVIGSKVFDHKSLFILCDGVGGLPQGDVAAQIVCESMLDDFVCDDQEDFLEVAINHAQKILSTRCRFDHVQEGMRTTLVALLIVGDMAQVAYVGDSRLYHFEGDSLVYKTKDHVKMEKGLFKSYKQGLLYSLGGDEEEVFFEKSDVFQITKETSFLLASDGFYEALGDRLIQKSLKKHTSCEWIKIMNEKIRKRTKKKKADNYSAIAIRMSDLPKKASESHG